MNDDEIEKYEPFTGAHGVLCLLVPACSIQESAITGDGRAYGYSWEQEIQIGIKVDQQIQQRAQCFPGGGHRANPGRGPAQILSLFN